MDDETRSPRALSIKNKMMDRKPKQKKVIGSGELGGPRPGEEGITRLPVLTFTWGGGGYGLPSV